MFRRTQVENVDDSGRCSGGDVYTSPTPNSSGKIKLAWLFVVTSFVGIIVFVLTRHFSSDRTGQTLVRNYAVCATDGCVRYSEMLQRSLSFVVSPCYNFYRYVCSGTPYSDDPSENKAASRNSEMLNAGILRMWLTSTDILNNTNLPKTSAWAGRLLLSCAAQHNQDMDSIPRLREFLKEHNLPWPHIPSGRIDLLDLLMHWTLNWNMDVWFSLDVFHFDASTRRTTFKLGFSADFIEWNVRRRLLVEDQKYESLISEYLRVFGVLNQSEIDEVLDVLPDIEAQIYSTLDTSISAYDAKSVTLPIRDLANLTNIIAPDEWVRAISHNLGHNATATLHDTLIIEDENLLVSLYNLLNGSRAQQENYWLAIGWSIVRDLGRLFSGHLSSLYGMSANDVISRCFAEVSAFTGPALAVPFLKATSRETFSHVRVLFQTLRSELVSALRTSYWVNNSTRSTTLERAHRIALRVLDPGVTPEFDRLFNDLPEADGNTSFFEAWKKTAQSVQKVWCCSPYSNWLVTSTGAL